MRPGIGNRDGGCWVLDRKWQGVCMQEGHAEHREESLLMRIGGGPGEVYGIA